jgi:hypothetical protein
MKTVENGIFFAGERDRKKKRATSITRWCSDKQGIVGRGLARCRMTAKLGCEDNMLYSYPGQSPL